MTEKKLHPGLNLGATHKDAHTGSEKKVFGFWVFLMSDLITFGILFATYIVMQDNRAMGPGPSALFDLRSVGVQTGLLLASSFTYGMASLSLKHRARLRILVMWLLVTALLGAAFLALEVRDFAAFADKGAVPQRSGWLSALWLLVGLHGFHIAVGLIWMAATLADIAVNGLRDLVKTRLLLLGLYWHFLDLIWISIASIVFLGGMA